MVNLRFLALKLPENSRKLGNIRLPNHFLAQINYSDKWFPVETATR